MYEILTNNLRHKSVHIIDFLTIMSLSHLYTTNSVSLAFAKLKLTYRKLSFSEVYKNYGSSNQSCCGECSKVGTVGLLINYCAVA